jgi:hypothetical protein
MQKVENIMQCEAAHIGPLKCRTRQAIMRALSVKARTDNASIIAISEITIIEVKHNWKQNQHQREYVEGDEKNAPTAAQIEMKGRILSGTD